MEFSAKTVNDCITNACQKFEITSDKLVYEVVTEGSTGFLGFNAKPAIIKARVKYSVDETVKELLSVGAWQIMLGPRQWKEYCDYIKEHYGWPTPEHIIVNNVYFKKESYCANKPTVYKNIIDAANEDINYVYVYDRENYKWKRYDSWKLIQGKYKL